ncbi:translocation/assembly module TamB domain-containing protein [Sphingomonas sp. LY160]|uniref:translocation/assembly module TamB domain-containing protein n=1 Tax=Sphingomonas sp. LY160 TaxID=3095342 RepID=UPI002ADEFC4B|nr:translocation/assembly module TamB domain-containing protein [Sphingomonas sp. LY160]MEA1072999.1 translocation/assembly module TamB domain-containing protein [Sphingomonas sp. LY160]
MTTTTVDDANTGERIVVSRRRRWGRQLAKEFGVLLLVLLGLGAGALIMLDTAPGHRFIVDRLSRFETATGLNIKVARIDGSIYGEARLRGVTVSDPTGVFLTSPEITLDWAPGAWLYNNLHIDRLESRLVRLERLPRLKPSGKKAALLPSFDIHIGQLKIDRLELARGVTGTARTGSVRGEATIRAGRAMVGLQLAMLDGDRVAARLDAEPDRNRFDLDVRAIAPADGLIPTLTGLKRPIDLTIGGDGSWTRWRGAARLLVDRRQSATLALAADSGRYRLSGVLDGRPFVGPGLRPLIAPSVKVDGAATFAGSVLDGQLTLASSALRVVARGGVDLAASEYRQVRLGVDLLKPSALYPTMSGRNVRLLLTLDGAMERADYAYRLTSPQVAIDTTGFRNVRAEGRGRLSPWPMRVPLLLKAGAITGVGDVAGGILGNLSIDGMLAITPDLIRGDKLKLRSDKLNGLVSVLLDLKTGRFDLALSGGLKRYLVPGLGIVDVETVLRVVPGPGGKGSRIVGNAVAQVRRLDNSFFASLAGGLPRLTTNLERGADGVIRFTNLQIVAPKLRLSGQGMRRRDGTFMVEMRGHQAEYGPLRLRLDGPIDRPKVELFLDRPMDSLGLRDVRLFLAPAGSNFDFRANGQSQLGPFTTNGQILLPRGGRASIAIAALNVAGTTARGTMRSDPGGFSGLLRLAGGGLDGTLGFVPVAGSQKIEAHLTATNFSTAGPPALSVRQGRIDGSVLLAPGRTTLDGVVSAQGLTTGGFTLARLTANARLVNGSGQVRGAVQGSRGTPFNLTGLADITPDQIRVTARGQVARRPLTLDTPAIITRVAGGWEVAPTRVRFGSGRGVLSGRTGDSPALRADIQSMPLDLLEVFVPRAGLGGIASGRVEYRWENGQPAGSANIRVRGLTRAGLVLASKPIDVGINAVLANGRAAMRAVAVSDGKTIGRAQARVAPLGRGPIVAELMNAPMQLQLRYAGPADTLWRLSGIEIFDLSGPIAVGADISGRLVDPQIRGSIRAQGARLESAVTGTVIEGLTANGRFNGSRLVLSGVSGTTPGGGTLTGGGTVDFGGGATALSLDFAATRARVLDRGDIAATVTGPIRVRSDGTGGTISGDLRLVGGRFTLGQASAAASVPQLQVRHVGREVETDIDVADLTPWRLDLKVSGGPIEVRGLGIDSRWRTDLTIGGAVNAPRMTGRADLIRGEYEFAGRGFRLERGIIRFRGESPPDPLLDIRAEAQVQGLDASVIVTGSGLRPEIRFASVPQLPEDELLSRILFGTSITNLSAPEALQLASAIAALQSGSGNLDPINAVRRAIGLDRLRILPADVATGQKTAISAGKYIGRRLFVEVITDGQGYSATRVEYQVTRWLSLLSSISTIGRTSANVRVSRDY